MYRILKTLCDTNPQRITRLAMNTNLNHKNCKRYLQLMSVLSWTEMVPEKRTTVIMITDTGRRVEQKLSNFCC